MKTKPGSKNSPSGSSGRGKAALNSIKKFGSDPNQGSTTAAISGAGSTANDSAAGHASMGATAPSA